MSRAPTQVAPVIREGKNAAHSVLVSSEAVCGPAADAGASHIVLQDGLARRNRIQTGAFAEVELEVLKSPGVSVGAGQGAADECDVDEADSRPRRRQNAGHCGTQPS